MIAALIACVVCLGFAAASAQVARSKNLNVAVCTALGFVLPIAGLLIVLVEPPPAPCEACGHLAQRPGGRA